MADITKILQAAEQGISQLAKTTFAAFGTQATSDGKAFLQAARADLESYAAQLQNNEITVDEFKDLIQDQADLAIMQALKKPAPRRLPSKPLSTAR